MSRVTRRQLLAAIPASAIAGEVFADDASAPGSLTFGFITDVHHGTHLRDAVPRLEPFIAQSTKRKVDFILQCGDFHCHKDGPPAGAKLIETWNRFEGPRYHVLGNHDHDFMTKEQAVEMYKMPAPHYSFDAGGFHFVVLDRNYFRKPEGAYEAYSLRNWNPLYAKGEYYLQPPGSMHSCIDETQMKWLEKDLLANPRPTVLFMHQPVVVGSSEGNWFEVAFRLDLINAKLGKNQIIAAFSGHDHDEAHTLRHGIHYLTLNSAAFSLPISNYRAHYYQVEKPLYTFVTLEPRGKITIEASESAYEPTPVLTPDVSWMCPPRIAARQLEFTV